MSETTAESSESAHAGAPNEVSGAALHLAEVTKLYPGQAKPAVDALSLDIPAGEIVMFVGPSGCGKTTSLKMINRLIEPTSGTITIDGDDIKNHNVDELRRTIGYVIQGGSLFPHLTVAANVGLVPGLLKWDKKRIAARTDELLDLVGLDPARYRNRFPRELSGGQQQRVGVARGLAADPPVVLMDEPFGAVDPITRQRLQDELLRIQREVRKTIVCVTHDIDEAIKLGDRILILTEGAHIAQYDTPETILAAPANEFVEDFVGSGSALKQLSLARVDDLTLVSVVTATLGESVAQVRERAAKAGETWIVVLDDRSRPLGWVRDRALRGERIGEPQGRAAAVLDRRATLNDALDTMLADTSGGAIVTGDRDEFIGVVTFDAVTDHMRKMTNAAQERAEASSDAPEGEPGDRP
ncbi:osmoprotectant transport system ATP-binding protein [Kineosphaera limosa]|uniref:ABC-type quaternary amine transporter n=1 Tax=Kineosphaera limosa NBRC 100340 TaxID=1184609 RepID=K6WXT0_9MICO|nr:ABC transporter ATP-binding protein [Kineosphaera limosa]NYE00285.1 osmoprotectant transport system ATP-binding protein [Kineosphaera limosa]GAB96887.1 putative ABC transporter ATP-binding protein [Kineosphaera limosa NBRC 100340]